MKSTNTSPSKPKEQSPQSRLFALCKSLGVILLLGLGYALWIQRTGLAIPCGIRVKTGLLCPGCGVTTLCLALLRGDLLSAWGANPFLLLISPLLAVGAIRFCVRYVKTGDSSATRGEELWGRLLCVLCLLWFVWRNWG